MEDNQQGVQECAKKEGTDRAAVDGRLGQEARFTGGCELCLQEGARERRPGGGRGADFPQEGEQIGLRVQKMRH